MISRKRRPVPPPGSIERDRLLIVEGDTPMHFCEALLRNMDIAEKIEIRSYGGNGQLTEYLRVLGREENFEEKVKSIGIIRDAEDDAEAARQAVRTAAALSLPAAIPVHVYILPDDASPGMIETLCLQSVQNHPAMPCVHAFANCIDLLGTLPNGNVRAKNITQVFLASTGEVQMFPGTAAYRDIWPFDDPIFDNLKQFMRNVLEANPE